MPPTRRRGSLLPTTSSSPLPSTIEVSLSVTLADIWPFPGLATAKSAPGSHLAAQLTPAPGFHLAARPTSVSGWAATILCSSWAAVVSSFWAEALPCSNYLLSFGRHRCLCFSGLQFWRYPDHLLDAQLLDSSHAVLSLALGMVRFTHQNSLVNLGKELYTWHNLRFLCI